MSKTLLIYNNEALIDLYTVLIHGHYDSEILYATSIEEAFNHLEKHSIGLVFIDFMIPKCDLFLKKFIKQDQVIPLVLTADGDNIYEAKRTYKTQTLLHYFRHDGEGDKLFLSIDKMLKQVNRTREPKTYCKINLSFFFSTKEVFCDVYVKISETKYIKIMNRYEQIDLSDLKRLEQKNIKYLYVKQRDFALIIKRLVSSLDPLKKQSSGKELVQNLNISPVFSIQLQETVAETINKIGLNQEALEMTSVAIDNTMNLVERNNEVFEILNYSIKRENYLSEHSFLLSYLGCAILKESPYSGEEAFLAITLAAFFHDVTLEDSAIGKIQVQSERKFKNLGVEEQLEYLSHPKAASDIVKKIEGIPKEVNQIIENHHERYNGSGFPNGLNYRRLSPICSIFNVAHEIALYLYDSGNDREHVKEIILELEDEYQNGHYAMAIKAAKVVFGLEMSKLKSA